VALTTGERMRKLRDATSNAYGRARNAAERDVVDIVRQQHPKVYEQARAVVVDDRPGASRAQIQAAVRQSVAKWYREVHPAEWKAIFDGHLDERDAEPDVPVEIRRNSRVGA
jgi:hypothetical protein